MKVRQRVAMYLMDRDESPSESGQAVVGHDESPYESVDAFDGS